MDPKDVRPWWSVPVAVAVASTMLVGGISMRHANAASDDVPVGPRAEAWKRVQQALDEGKPKTAAEALAGVEEVAVKEKAWAEVARAIATRVLTATGDRPPDDPERLVQLAAAIEKAPAETQAVLRAIQANWTWGFFQNNRWRFAQRTAGGAATDDLATIASWDLPGVVGEIRRRFTAALVEPAALQKLPVAEWTALIAPGSMPDAYRPTVWDVIARDALEFATSGERGVEAPEDVFEVAPDSPALGTADEFLTWKPEEDPAVTDRESPLLEAARLYRDLLLFHRNDPDRTAFLAADLDRILWAAGAAVGEGLAERKQAALEAFIVRAGAHETAALAGFHLAGVVREAGDLVEARAIAAKAVAAYPKSPGGLLCKNLIAEIEAKSLTVQTERTWAEPWPVIRITARNLDRAHVRIVPADWLARVAAGKPQWQWLDDADRKALLAQAPVKAFAVEVPDAKDFSEVQHDVPVPKDIAPGSYWVLVSHAADFGDTDNVVEATLVWVSRLAIVADQGGTRTGDPLAGYVVDIKTGEPLAGAAVKAFVQEEGRHPPRYTAGAPVTTDREGRFALPAVHGRQAVLHAQMKLDGRDEATATEPTHVWQHDAEREHHTIVLMTDRGIHRPGQIVFYKGIACLADPATRKYAALADKKMKVVLRDANGRETAHVEHTTNANGSFHGNFPIATGALPGQWSILAEGAGATGVASVRVEEYKRPKFQVTLAKPSDDVVLDRDVTLSGTATTYTGLPVANAKVRWHVEREVRFPPWCRWFFPWLPFGGEAARIARGTAITDANGVFFITFPAKPDRAVPRESAPVFTFAVTADVTDAGGETRSDEHRVVAGYAPLEASLSAEAWQAVGADGAPAAVSITLTTHALDGGPRAAAGTLTVRKLVQPDKVPRASLLMDGPQPARPRRGGTGRPAAKIPPPQPADPADVESWAVGEAVFTEKVATDAATGKLVVMPMLPPGIYRAEFEMPAAGNAPAVKARQTIEVLAPSATAYGVKRPFVLVAERLTAQPGSEFKALVGTGYDRGRALVEVSQAGKTLSRFWTEPGRTQWPVSVKVGDEQRGGFTVRAWLVHDGRLESRTLTVDVPWTNQNLAIEWERFTRRVEPGKQEVWRAKIMTAADPLDGPAAPAVAEMAATLYDQSLDALAQHEWPSGLSGLFRREWDHRSVSFTNAGQTLNQILGYFDVPQEPVEMTYRELRAPFGPQAGGMMFGGGRRHRGAMPMAMAAAPAEAMMADGVATNGILRKGQDKEEAKNGGVPPAERPATQAAAPPPRTNLAETAFFLPTLTSNASGMVTLEFTLPDTLTAWQFKALAHDAKLRSGTLLDTCIAAKDLMVEPMVPRFLREGDTVEIPVKVSNKSTGRLAGEVRFELTDARTGAARNELVATSRTQPFDLAAGESRPVFFTVKVADGTETLRYLATGSAGKASDGEEAMLPVLAKRVLVTETVPITIRGPGEKRTVVERLAKPADTIESQSLVIQAASNPAWYAVLALPAIIEESDESTETLFTRLYANSLARHLATRDPRIAKVFEQWKGTKALESPLEKNADLMKTLLAETPWVREAVDEKEARARIALLFDANRAANEVQAAFTRLDMLRNADGGWPWFPGGATCDSVTLGIIAGFGRLRANGVEIDVQPAVGTIGWLDNRLIEEKKWAEKVEEPVLTPIGCFALYARSFFKEDVPLAGPAAEAHAWGLDVGKKRWMKVDYRRSQGHLAIAIFRHGDHETAKSIVESLKERSTGLDGQEDNWQGMWWRDPHPVWWSWASAPIETQSIMIEAFDEVAGDARAVEALKAWLLSQKRTSRWEGNRATADAVAALLGRGEDLLASQELVSVTVGGEAVKPANAEAGTGFFEERFVRREITPRLADVVMRKADKGIAWG
ncbi:MAG: alpha-2-macroglobulin family protein, partial [Planctomycetia bacterium]